MDLEDLKKGRICTSEILGERGRMEGTKLEG